jgi:metal-responsive CopG/Arc/MetJ family transcriptional regulator
MAILFQSKEGHALMISDELLKHLYEMSMKYGKTTTSEVLHDIITEHIERLKRDAGG